MKSFEIFDFPDMTFGLRNAAQTFQRFLNDDIDLCYTYIDDILVASSSKEEHLDQQERLFELLRDYGVVINSSKCAFD